MFRAKLTKIANSKLGTSLLLMISGAALTSIGYDALKVVPKVPPVPKPPTPPDSDIYVVKKGDSFWKIAKEHLPKGSSNADINAYMYQLAKDNALKTKLIDGVLTKIPKDPDLIYPGAKFVITKFLGK
jgi:nucleoid-associated protein YgaU